MKKLSIVIALVIGAILVINGTASTPIETADNKRADRQLPKVDPVVASFERELTHQPVQAAPVRRDAIDDDVLYRTMNEIHWTPDDRSTVDKIVNEDVDEAMLFEEIELEPGE